MTSNDSAPPTARGDVGAAGVCSCLGAVAQVHHAAAQPALIQQLQLKPDPVGEQVLGLCCVGREVVGALTLRP